MADGTGPAERGSFHSFITGETESVFDFLIRQGGERDFTAATRRIASLSGVACPAAMAREITPTASTEPPSPQPGGRKLPDVRINGRQFRDTVDESWRALLAANSPPQVFRRSRSLVRVVEGGEGPIIERIDEPVLYGHISRVANWVRVTEDAVLHVNPPKDVAREMVANPRDDIPFLETLIRNPVFGRDGDLLTRPGYHASDRLWFAPTPGLALPPIPAAPSADEIAAARSLLLDEALGDFPFCRPSDRAHAVAAILLPFVRRMISGPAPIHLVEAPTPGSGKGLLCHLIQTIATGASCEARTLPEHEDEIRKMFTAELTLGRPVVLLDNGDDTKKIHSSALASVTTSDRWTDRILGESRMTSLANVALWLMTANNPSFSMELARRCVRIRIDPATDQPWRRPGETFRHPQLLVWAREHRAELIAAVLTLVRAWDASERPTPKKGHRLLRAVGGLHRRDPRSRRDPRVPRFARRALRHRGRRWPELARVHVGLVGGVRHAGEARLRTHGVLRGPGSHGVDPG